MLDVTPKPEAKGSGEQLPCGAARRKTAAALPLILTAVALLAVALYWRSTSVGFLLDDLFHIDYSYKALHGHPEELLKRFWGTLSLVSDGLNSYRPAIALTMFSDFVVWNTNAAGFHITNLLMFAGCCAFVSLLGWELSTLFNVQRRATAAFAAGSLFACYPLHPESVAWIIGRVDLQCSLLYLASVWLYLRFRTSERRKDLWLSVLSFVLALFSKEMAVTLPVVTTAAAWLLFPDRRKSVWKDIGIYWWTLASFAALRTMLLGTVVGGYGGVGKHSISLAVANFTDKATLLKLLYGASDEVPLPAITRVADYVLLTGCALCTLAAALKRKRLIALFAFLSIWSVATVLPTFQIWHVFPNLVGSRLFFLGSAPLCLLLALGAAATFEGATMSLGPLFLVAALSCLWGMLTQANLQPWLEAGRRVTALQQQVTAVVSALPAKQTALFLDVPQDYQGAPMIGRPEFLQVLCRPPFAASDLTSRMATAERPVPGGHGFIFPGRLKQLIVGAKSIFVWNQAEGHYLRWQPASPAIVDLELPASKFARLRMDERRFDPTTWLPLENVAGSAGSVVTVTGSASLALLSPELYWETETGMHSVGPSLAKAGILTFVPGRLRDWTQATIKRVGLRFPRGRYTYALAHVSIGDGADVLPAISLNENWVHYDASQLETNGAGPASVRLFVSKKWQAFPDFAWAGEPLPESVQWSAVATAPQGRIALPPAVTSDGAVREVAALAIDSSGKPVGLLSEPVFVNFSPTPH